MPKLERKRPPEYLREARVRAGYVSRGTATTAVPFSPETIGRHERGDIALEPEDAVTYSSRITDISTLVQENTQKFILGARDLSEFDAYVEDVKALNIEDLIQFQQAAYDRYKNR